MTLTIEIPQDLEVALSNEAIQLGVSLPDYALQVLSSRKEWFVMPQTGAELVDYWYQCGVIGSRTDIDDAPSYARELRQEAETRSFEYLN